MKIYDCFQFFNELDLLEIRLESLYNEVDYFVISETTRTHSDLPKPSFYLENKQLFEKYSDKIIHVITDYPTNIQHFEKREGNTKYDIEYNKIAEIYHNDNENDLHNWPNFIRDYLQREFIKLGLLNCEDNDIIMVSDLDEIPKAEIVKRIKEKQLVNHCVMIDCHYYYINNLSSLNSYGAYAVRFSETKNIALTGLRNKRKGFEMIYDGGWHLSFQGGPERIKTKIESYSHQEYNNDAIKGNILNKLSQNTDIFNRPGSDGPIEKFFYNGLKHIQVEGYYPENIIKLVREKFPYLIKN